MKQILTWLSVLCVAAVAAGCKTSSPSPALKTRNVFLITTDGLRWQEVFAGADEQLISSTNLNNNPPRIKMLYWRATPEERRKELMPFMWSEIASHGQIFGNRAKGSPARVINGKNFSYPGYNEFLTGIPDPEITSNTHKLNRYTNVFEWLNQRPRYHGKVAAVVNWQLLPYILNTPRSQIPVWTPFGPLPHTPVLRAPEILENVANDMTPVFSGTKFDALTHHVAMDYIRKQKPRAFYISYSETDEWAHNGRYDRYLIMTKKLDLFIYDLWQLCQSMPQYRDKTTFIITTDHGRGSEGLESWKHHNWEVPGSEQTWIAIIGPDTPALGERTNCAEVTAAQVPATIAALLGEDYHAAFPESGEPIREAIVPQEP